MENSNYNAKVLKTNCGTVLYRQARTTPIKQGAFVAVWKRNSDGETVPYDQSDALDFYIIEDESKTNYFCFPKAVLIDKGIVSSPHHKGKRGFRLYKPDLILTSTQAKTTQMWQKQYFHNESYLPECK